MAIDTGLVPRNIPQSLLREVMDGYDRGQAAKAKRSELQELAGRKKKRDRDEMRAEGFESNLSGLMSSYGDFAYTPEGRQSLLKDLATGGYGKEAMALGRDMDPLIRKPEKAAKPEPYEVGEYADETGKSFLAQYRKSDPAGTMKPIPGVRPKAKEVTPEATKYQPVKNKQGKIVGWNPATGLDKDGNPVEFWVDPNAGGGKPRYSIQEIGGRKIKVNLDTNEQVDLGPITPSPGAPKPGQAKLSASQQGTLADISEAQQMLNDLATEFNNSGAVKAPFMAAAADVVESIPLVGGKMAPVTAQYNDKRRITAEKFLRAATGAAAPAAEVKFYSELLPEMGDKDTQAQSALAAFRDAVKAKATGVSKALRLEGREEEARGVEERLEQLFAQSTNIAPAKPPQRAAAPSAEDSKAVRWAKQNPEDPRAAEILRLNGVK